jgi:hypothetical protein
MATDISLKGPDIVNELGDEVPLPPPAPGQKCGQLTVFSTQDAQQLQPRSYVLKGLISSGEMSVIYGEPGCGKSFIVQYLAWKVAQGAEVFGRKVKPTSVLYIALEGEGGFHDRVKAFKAEYGDADFKYVAQSVNFFSDGDAVKNVIRVVKDQGAKWVIVDTLARAMSEGDENTPRDMGRLVTVLDGVKQETGAHITLVHHSGKDESRGMRGHSALNGAADVSMLVKQDARSEERTVEVKKNKNGPSGSLLAFKLRPVTLGKDGDGDDITTMVVEETDAPQREKKERRLSVKLQNALTEITSCIADANPVPFSPSPGMPKVRAVPRRDVLDHFRRKGLLAVRADNGTPVEIKRRQDAERSQLQGRLEGLKAAHKIEFTADHVWLL